MCSLRCVPPPRVRAVEVRNGSLAAPAEKPLITSVDYVVFMDSFNLKRVEVTVRLDVVPRLH